MFKGFDTKGKLTSFDPITQYLCSYSSYFPAACLFQAASFMWKNAGFTQVVNSCEFHHLPNQKPNKLEVSRKGGTPKSSIFSRIFHDQPSSYWGTPMTMETSKCPCHPLRLELSPTVCMDHFYCLNSWASAAHCSQPGNARGHTARNTSFKIIQAYSSILLKHLLIWYWDRHIWNHSHFFHFFHFFKKRALLFGNQLIPWPVCAKACTALASSKRKPLISADVVDLKA